MTPIREQQVGVLLLQRRHMPLMPTQTAYLLNCHRHAFDEAGSPPGVAALENLVLQPLEGVVCVAGVKCKAETTGLRMNGMGQYI